MLVRVARIRQEAEDIKSYALAPEPGYVLPRPEAGSHIDVQISHEIIRQYSLCNGPDETLYYEIAVKREPASRGGSRLMHECIAEGSRLIVSEPRNQFPVASDGREHLLLGGGIGITPLLSMLKHLSARDIGVRLHYFTRDPQSTAFRDILRSRYDSLTAFHTNYAPEEVVATIRRLLAEPRSNLHAYVCGPPAFMECCLRTAQTQGWQPENVHYEYFEAQADDVGAGEAFDLILAKSHKSVAVAPGQTMLEAIRQAGVNIDSSCEQGICGTCAVKVLEGEVLHCDNYLTEEEREKGDVVLACVSRGQGKLVLDL